MALGNPKITCELCASVFYKPFNLRRHMVNIHGCTYDECVTRNIYPIDSNTISNDSNNISINSNNIPINSINIPSNNNVILNDNDNNYNCLKCNKHFTRQWNLKRHEALCKGNIDTLACEYCNNKFAFLSSKYRHYKICIAKKNIDSTSLIIPEPVLQNVPIITNNIDTQNIQTQNNINTQNNNQNIILVYNPENMEFIKDHIGEEAVEYIKGLYPKVDRRIVMDYSKRILNLPENQCIKKDDLKSGHSKVHIGDNEWEKITDNSIYPKLACTMANNMSDYLYTKRNNLRKETFDKIISFVDYMSDEGYINTEDKDKEKKILQEFKSFVRELKLIVFNKTKKK